MSIIPDYNKLLDPRGPWARARRIELIRYAAELGIQEISEEMPKEVIVKILQSRGIQPPSVPPRFVGALADSRSGDTSPTSHHYNGSQVPKIAERAVEINADDLALQEWKKSREKPKELTFNEMRAELKASGVKLDRRWRMAEVRAQLEKLRSGQNTP
jgi:hypothetical protein